jgi:hypothetical protein
VFINSNLSDLNDPNIDLHDFGLFLHVAPLNNLIEYDLYEIKNLNINYSTS